MGIKVRDNAVHGSQKVREANGNQLRKPMLGFVCCPRGFNFQFLSVAFSSYRSWCHVCGCMAVQNKRCRFAQFFCAPFAFC